MKSLTQVGLAAQVSVEADRLWGWVGLLGEVFLARSDQGVLEPFIPPIDRVWRVGSWRFWCWHRVLSR